MEPTFSYIYSIPYIILFLIYFLLFLWENKLKKNNDDIKIIRYLGMLIFFIFFGFRGYLDTDFAVYYPMYETAPVISDSRGVASFFSNMNEDFLLKIEPGFKVILILFKSITPDYFFLQIISSLVDVLLLNYFFKKYSPQYALSFILFFIFSGLLVEINLIRNAKSILLFIYSIQYIRERKPIQFFVCNFIGLMLHTSAIFYFPLYFFLHKKIPPFVIWIFFFIGNFIYLSQFKFIGPIISFLSQFIGGSYLMMAQGYSENDLYNSGYGITFGFIERLMTFVLFYLFYDKIDEYLEDKEKLNIFYNVFFLYSITYLFLSEYSIFIDRITTLFVFSYWIIYAYIYEMLKSWFKTLFTIILFLFGLFKMYKSNNFIIRKYENILWNKPSISRAYYILGKHLDKILNPNTK